MASEIRKVGEQCPYRVGGRRHATLHPDVTFSHEDRSTCPADSRPGSRPHHRPKQIQPSNPPTRLAHERTVSARPVWSLAEEREACSNRAAVTSAIRRGASPGRKNTASGILTTVTGAASRVARSASVSPPSPFSACTTRPELLGRAQTARKNGSSSAVVRLGPGPSITPIRGPVRPQVRRRPGPCALDYG
jgi:hypothetical protein